MAVDDKLTRCDHLRGQSRVDHLERVFGKLCRRDKMTSCLAYEVERALALDIQLYDNVLPPQASLWQMKSCIVRGGIETL